jgi:hypothetical protein
MAFIACCVLRNYLHYTQSFFREKRHRLLVCRPNPRFNNTTTDRPVSREPNLRKVLDPSGLLRD